MDILSQSEWIIRVAYYQSTYCNDGEVKTHEDEHARNDGLMNGIQSKVTDLARVHERPFAVASGGISR